MRNRPYMYPLTVTAPTASTTVTAVTRIPAYSRFFWTHTIAENVTGLVILYDSIKGPIFNVPTPIDNVAGEALRPFPLPEIYVFEKGSVITATYNYVLLDSARTFNGIILCGFREIVDAEY